MSQLCPCHFMLSIIVGHILGRQIHGCHSELPKSACFLQEEPMNSVFCLKAGPLDQLRTQWSMLG